MKKLIVVWKKITSCKGILIKLILSIVLLAAFFIGVSFVYNQNGTEAATEGDLEKTCGTNVIFTYTHSEGKIVVKNKTGVTNPTVKKADFQTYSQTVTAYSGNCTRIVFSGVSLPADCSSFFKNCSEVETITFNSVYSADITNMASMFANCTKLKSVDLSSFDLAKVTTMSKMFQNCSSLTEVKFKKVFNYAKLTSLSYMFDGCTSLSVMDMNNMNFPLVTDYSYMFNNCTNLTGVLTQYWNQQGSSAKNLSYMFAGCKKLKNVSLGSISYSAVTTMEGMFSGCESLTDYSLQYSTSTTAYTNLTTISKMFQNCKSLTKTFEPTTATKLTNVSYMYEGCTGFEYIRFAIPSLAITNYEGLFKDCSNVKVIRFVNCARCSKATNFKYMFQNCTNLMAIDLSYLSLNSNVNGTSMFQNCPKLVYLNLKGVNWQKVTTSTNAFVDTFNIGIIELPLAVYGTWNLAISSTGSKAKYFKMNTMSATVGVYSMGGMTTIDGNPITGIEKPTYTEYTYGPGEYDSKGNTYQKLVAAMSLESVLVDVDWLYNGDQNNGGSFRDPGYNRMLTARYKGDKINWVRDGGGYLTWIEEMGAGLDGELLIDSDYGGLRFKYIRNYMVQDNELAEYAIVTSIPTHRSYYFPDKADKIEDYNPYFYKNDTFKNCEIVEILESHPHKLRAVIKLPFTTLSRSIGNCELTTANKGPYTYNGYNISLGKPSAKDEVRNLTYATDYWVEIKDSAGNVTKFDSISSNPYVKNAGNYTVYFYGKGDYSPGAGSDTYKYYNITVNKGSISNSGSGTNYKGHLNVLGLNSNIVYDRQPHTPTGFSLYDDTNNYTISNSEFNIPATTSITGTNVGTYTATATSKNINFTSGSSLSGSYTISPKPVSDSDVTVASAKSKIDYTMSSVFNDYINNLVLTYKGVNLTWGTDYKVEAISGYDMTSKGTQKVRVTGLKNFTGTRDLEFTIVSKVIKDSMITLKDSQGKVITDSSYVYDGTDHKPSVTIYDSDRKYTLKQNQDYQIVEYKNFKNAGIGSVSVKGINTYDGQVTVNYRINKFNIQNSAITITTETEYEHLSSYPKVSDYTIKDTREGINAVLPNDWFTFSFTNVDKVGTGSLVITAISENENYTGSSNTTNVVINSINIGDSRITVEIPSNYEIEYSNMKEVFKDLIKIKLDDDSYNTHIELKLGDDFDAEFLDDMQTPGEKHVKISGLNGFRGDRTKTFTLKDDDPQVLKITAKDGVYRPGDEIEFDFEFSENVFGGPNFVDLTLKPNVGQIEIGGNIMKLRYVPNSTIGHNMKMNYTVKEGDEILKGLDSYSSGWSQYENVKDVSGHTLVLDTLNLMVKNNNIKIVTDFATINLIKTGISADNMNITKGALSDYDRMSFLLDGENELKERILITEDDPKEVQKWMLIDYLAWYLDKVEVEGITQDEQKADIIKSLKDSIKLYDTEKELKSEKAKFDTAISNGTSYDDVMKVYNLVHPLNDEQKTLMNADYDKLLIYSYVKVESENINDKTKQADSKKSQSKDFIQDEVIFNKILKSSEKLTDEEKEYITKNYLNLQDLTVKDKVLERVLLYLSDEQVSGFTQDENKEIILRDIYNGIWVYEVEEGLKAEIEKEKPNYNWVKLLDMLEVLPVDIQYKTDKTLRTFIQDGYLNWRLDQIIQGNIDDPRPKDPTNPNDPATPSNPKPQDPSKPVDPKNIDPKEKKEAIIKAIDDDGILKRIVELTNLKDDEKKTLLDYIMVLDTDTTDEDKENKKDNREKFLEYLADSAMGFDSIQDALPKLAKATEDFYVIVDARLKIEEMLKKLADDPDSVNWDDILRLLDNLTDKQKQYLPDKFTEEIKKQYEEYLKSQDIKITQTGDDGGSKVNIYDVIGNLDIKPGDKPNILINMLNDIKNLNELRKLLSSDEVQTKLPDGDKTKQDERVISGFEFKVVDQSDPKRIIPLKSGSKVEIVFKLPELFAGKTVAFYTIADDGTVKKESVTMSSAVDGMCKASVLTDKYGKFIVTHNYVETIIRIKSNNGGATGTVTQSTKKLTDYICIPQSPNTVTSVKVYTYDIATGEYKEDTKLADTLHYPTYQIYESDEVPKGSIIEIQFLTESSGRKRVKELPSSRKFASYMKGKEVNFFKPNDGLTRAETAVLVSRILADDKESYEAEGKKWAKKGIENVINKEIMSTNENGDFRENDVITRGEFAKVIYKIVEQDIDKTVTKKFLDTDGKYYEEYANALFSNGLIDGFTDGEFKGDLQITRSEACKMINAATGRSDIADELILDDSEKKDFLEFIDVEDFRWFYKDVMLASNDFEIPNKFYETEQTSKNTKKK